MLGALHCMPCGGQAFLGDLFWGLVPALAIGVQKIEQKIAVPVSTHCGAQMRDGVVKSRSEITAASIAGGAEGRRKSRRSRALRPLAAARGPSRRPGVVGSAPPGCARSYSMALGPGPPHAPTISAHHQGCNGTQW